MLECDGRWFDKPADRAAARAQLRALSGRSHSLHSAACVARDGERLWLEVTQAKLAMRELSDGFLDAYLDAAGPAVTHSVGAYQLEGLGVQLFRAIDGDHFTVLGLPLLPLLAFLREHDMVPR
jgi:septum formation protein